MFKYSVANNFTSSVLMTYSDGLNYFGKCIYNYGQKVLENRIEE